VLHSLLTRVEGEGEVVLKTEDGRIVGVEVRISEAPRFFEYLVRGRLYTEVPDLVSRICGLCGVSYVITACRAFESCLGVEVPEDEDRLRMAILAAERVKSHVIHVAYLNLPDLVGLGSLGELFESYAHVFQRASRVVLWARRAMEVLGGRFHNVVNARVGGVYSFPSVERVRALRRGLDEVLGGFLELARFVLGLKSISEEVHRIRYMAVAGSSGYAWAGSGVVLDDGTYVDVGSFENYVLTEQVGYSNALRYRLPTGEPYLVGPLARFNTYLGYLREEVRELLEEFGWYRPLRGVQQSIVARVAETYHTLLELRDFLEDYRERTVGGAVRPERARGPCVAVTEAPRGVLYHRYLLDSSLRVRSSNIITPTAQNLACMEYLIGGKLYGSSFDGRAIEVAKSLVRAFDPCISCSVHVTAVEGADHPRLPEP
jgi:coenzyme F420-reducing hydrogenase alpha subunit